VAGLTHVVEHRAVQYRRTFRSSAFTSFLTPLLFLTAMGIGVGGYINPSASAALGGYSYLQFLAPGLLVATSMQSAAFEATFPIIGGLNWQRTFHAMYATPLSPRDIALGNLLWTAFRLAMIATVFAVIVVLMGAAASPAIVLGVPIAVLTGMSFAAPIAAFSATQRTPARFNVIFRFIITPLFLFSGVFFPVSQLPGPLQTAAAFTPLFHGVELTRGLALQTLTWPAFAVHTAYLSGLITLGTAAAVWTFTRKLRA